MNTKEGMRAVWIGVAITAGGNIVAEPAKIQFQNLAQRDVARADHTEDTWRDWREHASVRDRAYELVTRHEQPRRRGQRKARPYVLGMRPATRAEEADLHAVFDDIEVISALVATDRIDPRQLQIYLQRDIDMWLPALRGLRDRSQPTFDAQLNAQLEHSIGTLEYLLAQRRAPVRSRALRLEEIDLWPALHGRVDVQAAIYNPNSIDSPIPGVCVEYEDHAGNRVGHLLIWSSRRVVPALEAIPMMVTVPSSPSCKPKSVRLAASPSDLQRVRGAHYPFSDAPSFVEG